MNDPTIGKNGCPKDRKSRLVRTLSNLKNDPAACKEKGTTPKKVSTALTRLVRGITPGGGCQRAGIATSTKPAGGLGVRGAASDVAKRLIRMVGADHAKRIAQAVLEQTK